MKPSTLAIVVLLPTIGAAQGTPDTGNSKLWEMRKKVQQRNAQRAGSYLDQMSQSLTDGDPAGAESALKSAIAQGTLTQPQIDDARGRIAALVSRQQQEMVATARAKAEAESRAAEAQRMAEAQTAGVAIRTRASTPAASSEAITSSPQRPRTPDTEEGRFKAHWKSRTANFTVTWDDGGSLLNGTKLEVRDSGTGKKFMVHYNMGFDGLFDIDVKSAVGATVSIRFHDDGTPASIKNPANGRSTNMGSGWKATGYGW